MYSKFRVKQPLTNGFEPGELRGLHEFKGCDMTYLLNVGAIVGVGSPKDGALLVPDMGQATPDELKEEIRRLQQQLTERPEPTEPTGQLQPNTAGQTVHFPTETDMGTIRARGDFGSILPGPGDDFHQRAARQATGTRPGGTDHGAILQAIDNARNEIMEEIRRFASDTADHNADEVVERLKGELKAAQELAAHQQDVIRELQDKLADATEPNPPPGTPPRKRK